ncbi:MAG: adenylate/guanylate cyclase domain-containing protein [Candidatus Rokuibacteriota bacterium]
MQCPRCQHANRPGARFCEECAAPLEWACAACGAALSATAKFCPECAHPAATAAPARPFGTPKTYTPKHLAERILTSRAAVEGERKHVTVLFADLKGSMELLADRDPEEARRLLDPVLERMMEAVHRYEGTVNQVMGDGIMALFGAPLAQEDHAARACYAALAMHDSVGRYAEELRRAHGVDVQIRVGLNSGDVVVRSIGNDLHMDYTAVGQTTHLAARMEQLARPGSTLMTGATLRGAEGYVEVKPLGPMPIKGLPEPVPVYEVVGAGTIRTRLQASVARGLTQFVGRDGEIEQLRSALEQAARGRGELVAVVGEPGVGKSRLFYEFIHSHRTQGWLVLESSSVSYGKATPWLPLVHLLKSYFKIADRDDTRAIRAKVTGLLLTLDDGLTDSIAPVLWLLDVLADDHELLRLDRAQRRAAALEAVRRVLLREAAGQPLLLVFEDLHWIDAETQAFLDAFVESLGSARALLAVNYRPEYQHAWGGKTYYRQLRLDVLPPATAEALLAPLLGEDASLAPLRSLLIERTEGNPLFLEESVRALVETQALIGAPGAYRLVKDPRGLQVPATVQAILAARIDRLLPDDKRLLQTASVIGKDVPWALLLAIAGVPEDDLRRGLARLQAAEFVYEARLFPDLEYTFKHALTHEVAYGSLLHDRRRAAHGDVIAAIERVYGDRVAEHAERLAHHAFRGELWSTALRYLDQTSSIITQPSIDAVLGGPESPGNLWWRGMHERALALATRERAVAADFSNFAMQVTANFRLGQIHHSLGQYDRAAAVLLQNVKALDGELCRQMFGLAGLPSVFSRAWLAFCLSEQGAVEEADAYAAEAVAIALQEDHAFSVVVAHVSHGVLHARCGRVAAAITALEQGLVVERVADIAMLFPLVASPLGWAYAIAGRHDEGITLLQEAVARAEAMQFGANHAQRLVWYAEAQRLAGRTEDARRSAAQALDIARRSGERGHEAYARRLLGDLTTGDAEAAAEHYRAALALAESLGMRPLAADVATCLPSPR